MPWPIIVIYKRTILQIIKLGFLEIQKQISGRLADFDIETTVYSFDSYACGLVKPRNGTSPKFFRFYIGTVVPEVEDQYRDICLEAKVLWCFPHWKTSKGRYLA